MVIERLGKYSRALQPGLALLVPGIGKIAYVHALKEIVVEIPLQSAHTMDNVGFEFDGMLDYRIVDPVKASCIVEDPHFAISQLVQMTMWSEIGQLMLDCMLAKHLSLNGNIV
ncbi:hypothetical protein AMAG_10798 [Allomyces macrogynus ATCC 38327]|uniref:Band 7 domain-containing protein n=1 Tax=Allomyces macrogynus (strain ATCC 38327) TaxID=578462 RepID=A0A0L0SRZ8_ALLM3|nr:hypothetical protein AMAG_10798 [Allomyces macrogynus ATCC 38327]|eukprot:KNE65145.1 hypothetical protein AMAG_10798 [Allomyces macrogynus ATCC 38327]